MAESQLYHPIGKDAWLDHTPTKDQFRSTDLSIQSPRWEFHLNPTDNGENLAKDFLVPSGNVLVGWSANETSCIKCGGGDYQLVIQDGPLRMPIGVRPGSRLEPGGRFGSGASFTGVLTLISVPYSVWAPVAITMIPAPR
jgi:hypothetical protein